MTTGPEGQRSHARLHAGEFGDEGVFHRQSLREVTDQGAKKLLTDGRGGALVDQAQ